jgi:hypothetical protein
MIDFLEHITPDEAGPFLDGVREHLSDDGKLIVTVPSTNIPISPKHYRHFDQKSLAETLGPGFEIVETAFLNKKSLSKKLLHGALSNPLFIMNNQAILNLCYKFYTRHYLHAGEKNCRRVAVVCRKRD